MLVLLWLISEVSKYLWWQEGWIFKKFGPLRTGGYSVDNFSGVALGILLASFLDYY